MHSYITPLLVTLFGTISMVGLPAVTAAGNLDGREPEALRVSPLDEARATLESGNGINAVAQLVRYLGDDPGDAEAWVLLGRAYRALGQPEDAEAAYARALSLKPDHPAALLWQGELRLSSGGFEDARGNLARLTAICGGPVDEAAALGRAMDAQMAET